jgi:hypothetical protein
MTMRATKLAGTAVLLIGLGLGLASCADAGGDGYLANSAYPYDDGYYLDGAWVYGGDWGGNWHHWNDRRWGDHGGFGHRSIGVHSMGIGHAGIGRGMSFAGHSGGGGHR